jgi:hypothetical protein
MHGVKNSGLVGGVNRENEKIFIFLAGGMVGELRARRIFLGSTPLSMESLTPRQTPANNSPSVKWIPVYSTDRHEEFYFDIYRSSIRLTKANFQHHARQSLVLVRIENGLAIHATLG